MDPIDGTRLTALGINNALSVLAVSERGTMLDPSAVFYMEKLVTGPEAADLVDLRLPIKQNLHLIAKAKNKKVNQINVMILDRDRHKPLCRGDPRRRRTHQVHHGRRRGRRHRGRP